LSEKQYDGMTHDEIMRDHADRDAQMTPEAKARALEERSATERKKLEAGKQWRNQRLSELTLGDLTDAVEVAMENSIIPELQAVVAALEAIAEKLDRRGST
jgi:hypothetical protein